MSKQPTPEQKEIYRFIDSAFDGGARVREYIHDAEPLSIYIVSKVDCPWQGVTSYCTIGASEVEMQFQDGKVPIRVEFAGMCDTTEADFPYVLAAVAFSVLRTQRLVFPGMGLPGYVSEFIREASVPHLYLTSPSPWKRLMKSMRLKSKRINFLMGFGITDKELEYLEAHDDDALETLLEQAEVDVSDPHRKSAV